MKQIKFIITLIIFCTFNTAHAGVDSVLYSGKVETSLPSYVGILAGSYIDNIDFWKNGVIEEDRNFNEYLVIPSNGLVVPINHVDKLNENYTNIEKIDINNYLKNGVLSYPGYDRYNYGNKGNIVIFGHSSFWKSDIGEYKTHFQKIIGLGVGKEIWIYKKQISGDWKRFKYVVEKSYETTPTDISVIKYNGKKEMTLLTCTPIGGISGRWVIKSTYLPEIAKDTNKQVIKINNKLLEKIIKVQNTEERNKLILQINESLKILSKDSLIIVKIQKEFQTIFGIKYL